MIAAGIDLGTNTFDLLIVDASTSDWKLLHQEKQWVGLGVDFYETSCISGRAKTAAISCLTQFLNTCSTFHVDSLKAVGTSALRDALNGTEFVKALHDELNVPVEIITGEREAELVFLGLNSLSDFPSNGLIMDVGGGSTELISFQDGMIKGLNSLNIGVTRLMAQIDINRVLTPMDVAAFERLFNAELNVSQCHIPVLVGSAGPFETFYHLINRVSLPFWSCFQLPMDELFPLLDQLIYSTYQQRITMDSVPELRKKYLHLAALQIKWVIQTFSVNQVFASSAGLSDGLISAQILFGTSN